MREYLDAAVFKDMILCADAALAENTQQINELNVFPVPDGDTGTNMSLTFGAAVELAVAMPLSWLPLISDYTRQAQKPVRATVASVVTYGLVSCWMYVIGMGAAIFTGEYDIAVIMVKAGLGIAAPVSYTHLRAHET